MTNTRRNKVADKNFATKIRELFTGNVLKTSLLLEARKRLLKSLRTISENKNKFEVNAMIMKLLSSNERKKLYDITVLEKQ